VVLTGYGPGTSTQLAQVASGGYAEKAVRVPRRLRSEAKSLITSTYNPTCPSWFRRNREPEALKGLPMLGYLVVVAVLSAVVLLVGLKMFVRACVTITHLDSKNAAAIITAMGKSFPLQGVWSRRK
jgi:hypothetical protein